MCRRSRRIRPAQREPEPEPDVFELTDEMAVPAPPPVTFNKVEPQDDIEFTESKAPRRQPAYEPPFESAPARPILSPGSPGLPGPRPPVRDRDLCLSGNGAAYELRAVRRHLVGGQPSPSTDREPGQ